MIECLFLKGWRKLLLTVIKCINAENERFWLSKSCWMMWYWHVCVNEHMYTLYNYMYIYRYIYISDPLVRDPPTYPKYRELLCHRKSCVAGELCTLLVLLSCILRNVRHWILYLRSTYGWTLPVKYVRECSTTRFTCCIPRDDWFTCVWGLPYVR